MTGSASSTDYRYVRYVVVADAELTLAAGPQARGRTAPRP